MVENKKETCPYGEKRSVVTLLIDYDYYICNSKLRGKDSEECLKCHKEGPLYVDGLDELLCKFETPLSQCEWCVKEKSLEEEIKNEK
ncbi:MAG: hypothetical protein NUV46_02500 [Nanoarchaeota archaeon]|nr:hypothetical protein [Nanoarchaeota archaeon]